MVYVMAGSNAREDDDGAEQSSGDIGHYVATNSKRSREVRHALDARFLQLFRPWTSAIGPARSGSVAATVSVPLAPSLAPYSIPARLGRVSISLRSA